MNVILPIGEKRIPKHGDENAISVCGEYMGCPPCEKRIPKHGDENGNYHGRLVIGHAVG